MTGRASQSRLLDRTFHVSIRLKALDGAIELIGGLALLVLPAHWLHNSILREYSVRDTRTFGTLYLVSHGAAKIVLVVALLRGARWAIPALFWFLVVFITVQSGRMLVEPSLALAVLTAFDVVVAALVWREWRRA